MNDQCEEVMPITLTCPKRGPHEEHEFEMPIPPDVGAMISKAMDHADEEVRRLKVAKRWMYGAVAANVAAALINVTLALA